MDDDELSNLFDDFENRNEWDKEKFRKALRKMSIPMQQRAEQAVAEFRREYDRWPPSLRADFRKAVESIVPINEALSKFSDIRIKLEVNDEIRDELDNLRQDVVGLPPITVRRMLDAWDKDEMYCAEMDDLYGLPDSE